MSSHEAVFAKLNEIDWASLEHAYGDARDTPDRLRALVGDDAEKRGDARYWLSASIHHQGSLYSASAPAIPFLVAAARDPRVQERAWIVRFLAELAVGRVHQFTFAGFDLRAPDMTRWFEGDGSAPYRACYEAVAKALPDVLALFEDEDPAVRAAAAFTASFFAARAAEVRDAARTRLANEKDEAAIASLLWCIALQDTYTKEITVQALARPHYQGSPRLALAAAIAGTYGTAPHEGADGTTLDVFRAHLGGAEPPDPWKELPWARGDLGEVALAHLVKLVPDEELRDPKARAEAVMEILFAVVERVPLESPSERDASLAQAAMRPLFRLVTPAPAPEGGWTKETLRPTLRRFAEAIARRPFLGSEGLYAVFEENALPGDVEALQAWLGVHVPSALDETIAAGGVTKTAREWLAAGAFDTLATSPRAVAIAVEASVRGARGTAGGAIDGMAFQVTGGDAPKPVPAAEAILAAAIGSDAPGVMEQIAALASKFAKEGPPKTYVRAGMQIHQGALTLLAGVAAKAAERSGRAPDPALDVLVEAELTSDRAWPTIERYFRAIGGARTEALLLGLAERGWKKTWPDSFGMSIERPFVTRAAATLEPAARERFILAIAEQGDTSALDDVLAREPTPKLVEVLLARDVHTLEQMESYARDDIEGQRTRMAARYAKAGMRAYGPVAKLLAERGATSPALKALCEETLAAIDGASDLGAAMRDARLDQRDERGLMPLASARKIVEATTIYRKGEGEMKGGTFVLESDLVWAALLSLEDANELVKHATRIQWEFHVRGRENIAPLERYGAGILPWIEHHIDERGVLHNIPWCLVPCLLAIDSKDALAIALKVDGVHELLPNQAPLGGGPGAFAADEDEDAEEDEDGEGDESEEDDGEDEGEEGEDDDATEPQAFLTPTLGLDLAKRWLAHHGHGYAMLAELAAEGHPRATELLRDRARALGVVVVEAIESVLGRDRTQALVGQLGLAIAPLDPEIEAALAAAETVAIPRGPLWTVSELDDAAREYELPLWDNAAYTTGAMRVTGFASASGDALVVEVLTTRVNPLEVVGWEASAYGPGAKERSAADALVDAEADELEAIYLDDTNYVSGITNEIHLWDDEEWRIVPVPLPHEHLLLTVQRAVLGMSGDPHKATHKLPRAFAELPEEEREDIRAITPLEGLLFQLCAKAKDQMFAYDTQMKPKLGIPEDAVELFSFDDVEWVAAGEPASSSKDIVLMCEALRRRKKITRLVGNGRARPEHWAPAVAEIRSYDGDDAWPAGEEPYEPVYPEGGIGASPYLSWLATTHAYPHGISLLHSPAYNEKGMAEQTVPYLLGCTDFVMQTSWPRRTACLWARVIGGAQKKWSADDPGVARAMKQDKFLFEDEAKKIVGSFVARKWSPPAYVGAELVRVLEALVGPQQTLAMFVDALASSDVGKADRPAVASAAFELGFVLMRTRVDADALRARLEALAAKNATNDVGRALDLVLHGRAAAERHAKAELDYAFVTDDPAWAKARILDPATAPSRTSLYLASIAGEAMFDKWMERFASTADLGWLGTQAAKAAGPKALAIALRVYTERPELQPAMTTVILERPAVSEELTAALRGPFADAARALLDAIEAREEAEFDRKYGGDDDEEDDDDDDESDDDESDDEDESDDDESDDEDDDDDD